MKPAARKNKGKKFETKIAEQIHEHLYSTNIEYKTLYDAVGNEQVKPKRDSSSGTFTTSTGDIELGVAQKFFPFSIECKHWALLDLTLNSLMTGKIKSLETVWKQQCLPAAKEKGLEPLLVFKANRTETFVYTQRILENVNIVKVGDFFIYKFTDFIGVYTK